MGKIAFCAFCGSTAGIFRFDPRYNQDVCVACDSASDPTEDEEDENEYFYEDAL